MIITHLTDVEGNMRYVQKWADRSRYIQFENGVLSFRIPQSSHKFIYGGDFCDKGPGDLRLGRALIDFKTKHPLDVILIAGNRDIKCRRFTYELDHNIRQRLLNGPPAFWNQRSTPQHYVIKQMKAAGLSASSILDIEHFIQNQSKLACKTIYLKWMLFETMGSGSVFNKPDTFEYRRMELAQIGGALVGDITDDQVTSSFLESVSQAGVITQYLKAAQLGVIIGETLFIHGAVTPENMGHVPDMAARIPHVKEWIEALNHWYAQQITDWLNNPTEHHLNAPGHKPLDQYIIMNPKSVVTTNWYTNGKLMPINDDVVAFLNNAGIYRVVSGHQPFSDFPLIIRSPDLEVIVGDTSYSDRAAKDDCRGEAIHNLDIHETDKHSYATIGAIRRDGSSQRLTLPSHAQCQHGSDTSIGHFTQDGRLIRPVNDSVLVGCQLDGFVVIDTPINTLAY